MRLLNAIVEILIFTLVQTSTFAQRQGEDRVTYLKSYLAKTKEDTNRVKAFNSLSEFEGWRKGDSKNALFYAKAAKALSEKLGYKSGIAHAHNNLGSLSWIEGNYPEALMHFNKALKIREEIADKVGIAGSHNNIGAVCQIQGKYPEALKEYFAALRVNEELNNKEFIAANHNNIGTIYTLQNNLNEALKEFSTSLKIREELGDKYGIAESHINLGTIYNDQKKYAEALKENFLALQINKEIGNKEGISSSHANIASIYSAQKKYPEALKEISAAMAISQEIGDQFGTASCYNSLGTNQIEMNNPKAARESFFKQLEIAKAIGAMDLLMSGYYGLCKADSALLNFKDAFENHKLYIQYRDSLNNEENTRKSVQTQMQYEFDKREEATRAEQEKKDIRQRNIRNSITIGLVGALIFLVVVYRQRNKINKEKKRSEELLLNILPEEVAEELKAKGEAEAKQIDQVTVLFTDFKGFTQLSEKLTPKELVAEIDYCFRAFDNIMQKNGVEKIKTIGDAYMAAGGLPVPNQTHAENVVNAALEIQQFMKGHKEERAASNRLFFEIRIGIHTGPVVTGIVGIKKFAYDIWGDTVNTASRMESSGEAGKVNISVTTYELVKEKFICTHRGKITAKGKGEIDMYFVEGKN